MENPGSSDLTYESLVHDLNNVFETITEAAELLSTDKNWKALAATLQRSVARGKRLVGAIPDQTPDLAMIVADATQSITDYCVAARKPRIDFVQKLSPGLRLPGSAKDWERVFANLFLNALQALRKPGQIEITAEQAEGILRITVADNGPGIQADILPKVFKSSVSTKGNTSTRTGLGLHIVASIIKENGGKVSAANQEKSSGAVFTILLPMTV